MTIAAPTKEQRKKVGKSSSWDSAPPGSIHQAPFIYHPVYQPDTVRNRLPPAVSIVIAGALFMMLIHRKRNDHTWWDSELWSNPGSTFHGTHAPNGYAAIKSQDGQDSSPLLPLLCLCIYQLLWTYIFFWRALHGIISDLRLAELKRRSNMRYKRQSHFDVAHQDCSLIFNKGSISPLGERHSIVRDSAFDQFLSQILVAHVELAVKGFLLLPQSGFFASVLIPADPRSTLLDVLTPEAFPCTTDSHTLPVCVPWTSPSLRQHMIAKVLSSFQCMPNGDFLHHSNKCYTPTSTNSESFETDWDENKIIKIASLSGSVRLKSGTKSSSTQGRPYTSNSTQSSRASDSFSSTNRSTTHLLPTNNLKGQETSDEDEEKPRKAKKRKIPSKSEGMTAGLPCIYHVFDPATYTRGPRWKYCNPQNREYPDPSDLSRHLERKHDLVSDKQSVRTTDSSIAVCKNCWSKIIGPVSHWTGNLFTCVKPRHNLTPIEKFWAWFDAFCGQRTQAASEYLDSIMGEAPFHHIPHIPNMTAPQDSHGHATGQLPHLRSSDTAESSSFPAATGLGFSLAEASNNQQPYIQTQSAPAEHLLQSPTFEQHNLYALSSVRARPLPHSKSLRSSHRQGTMGYDGEGSIAHTSASDSQQSSLSPFWHIREFSVPDASSTTSYAAVFDERQAKIDDLFAQLQLSEEKARLAEEKAQSIEEENRELKETCKRQLIVIENLSEGRPLNVAIPFSQAKDGIDPTLFTTPARSNTRESTDSDLSGIATQDEPKTVSFDEFLAEFPDCVLDLSQDTQGVHYLPEKNTIPHTEHGKPSTAGDSGYGTNPANKSPEPLDLDTASASC